ncbi:hypothetical protein F909_03622 [Acinetobacter sp. ANC 3929]|uniref:hypothetical protein n=1 Tax=Acinetobacter sp. ANC 3929 TaxID=1217707 RepID=UPI0002CF3D8E|nr:hypothetical protein [Acinetobacter sp. ANC 3929]ENW78660.1 hypothetical protein F909_03622 [Acinetobacter sp. ANC 3929]
MPKYTYQGEMGRVSARTATGPVMLPKGVEVEITDDQHEALANHPAFTALEKSGELTVTDVKKAKSGSKTGAAAEAAKAAEDAKIAEIKAKLTELNVEFGEDESLKDLQAKLAQAK